MLVHRLRGGKMYFHQATKDRRIVLIPGTHYFDAHRLQPLLLQAPTLQVHMRESSLVGLEGAGEQVDDPSSDEEQSTTASETEAESEDDDEVRPPEEPWCPPIPPAMDDPTEQEIKGAADKVKNSSLPFSTSKHNMFGCWLSAGIFLPRPVHCHNFAAVLCSSASMQLSTGRVSTTLQNIAEDTGSDHSSHLSSDTRSDHSILTFKINFLPAR